MERIKFLNYKSKKILTLDASNLIPEEIPDFFEKAREIIFSEPEKSILALSNVENVKYNSVVIEGMKNFVKFNAPYIKTSAIIGLDSFKQIVLQGVLSYTGRSISTFNCQEEAMEWLINQ